MREAILAELGIGLRTYYRELELLKRVGVKVRLVGRDYTLLTSSVEAEGRLPFPDPQLSFAEMAELAPATARPESGWPSCCPASCRGPRRRPDRASPAGVGGPPPSGRRPGRGARSPRNDGVGTRNHDPRTHRLDAAFLALSDTAAMSTMPDGPSASRNTTIRDRERRRPRRRRAGRGREREVPFGRADARAARQPEDHWTRLTVRDGERGPLSIDALTVRVRTKQSGGSARRTGHGTGDGPRSVAEP